MGTTKPCWRECCEMAYVQRLWTMYKNIYFYITNRSYLQLKGILNNLMFSMLSDEQN